MIATAFSTQMDAIAADPQFPSGQNLLLASSERPGTDRLVTWLDKTYRCFPASSERRLLTILEHHAIHLIIIDTGQATIADGIRLCSRLKSAPQSAHLPVIFLVPEQETEVRINCLRAGADACMEKPLSRDHLRAQVRNLLGNRDRLKKYFQQPFTSALASSTDTGENLTFVRQLNEFISANLHDEELNVDWLAQRMNISRPTLYRKIRYLSKQTPNEMINFIRLNKAAELLSTGEHKVFKIARMVGFPSRSNFGKAFVKQFGLTPKEYLQRLKSRDQCNQATVC